MKKLKKIYPIASKEHAFPNFDKSLKKLVVPVNGRIALFARTTTQQGIVGEASNEIVHLVFAPVDATGQQVGTETVSLALPCPPFCGKGRVGGDAHIMVVTQD